MPAAQRDLFGAHARGACKARGLKQPEAAVTGIFRHLVIARETGEKQPAIRRYPAILALLGHESWCNPQTL